LAIKAVRKYNETAEKPLKLKIAGKHYTDYNKDNYWQTEVEPELDDVIEYVGFIDDIKQKNIFLGNAKALIIPSTFEEPFGMVMIEALASGTPIIGLDSGAIPEVISKKTGIIIKKSTSDDITAKHLSQAIKNIDKINRKDCRKEFENRFTLNRMCQNYADTYRKLQNN
jgi:glycosyltransferase involved in cell wall biosynthesis